MEGDHSINAPTEITKEVRAAMIAKRTARKNEGIAEAERLKLDTEAKRTERIRLHLRGWPDLNRDASRVKRCPSSFEWHKPCCVVHRASGARWLYPEGLGFDQMACAWGNDYAVVYANMLGIRIQFNENGEPHWKRASGHHRRSLAETAMSRFKQLLAGKLSLRNYNNQVGEVMAYVCAMNKLNTLGLPVRKPHM